MNFFEKQEGWVCPKCGRVYSPIISMCFFCGGNNQVTITNTSQHIDNHRRNENWEQMLKNIKADTNTKITFTDCFDSNKKVRDD